MKLLAINQVFNQKLLVNNYINLDIINVIFEKEFLLININNQTK